MVSFKHTVRGELGFHARTAGLLSGEAARYRSQVVVSRKGRKADAKRLFSLLALGVRQGDRITVVVKGVDEAPAARALRELCLKEL